MSNGIYLYTCKLMLIYRLKAREDQGEREAIPHSHHNPSLEGIDFLTDNVTSRVAWKLRGGRKVQNTLGLAGEYEMRVSSQRISQLYT